MYIRDYKETDETGWVRCRVLSLLDTAYFDNVLRVKEKYTNPAVELVAIENEQVIGLIDVECESQKGTVCSNLENGLEGMIYDMAYCCSSGFSPQRNCFSITL